MPIQFSSSKACSRRGIWFRLGIWCVGLSTTLTGCNTDPEASVRINGSISDGYTLRALEGHWVSYGEGRAITDVGGRFSLTVAARPDTLRVMSAAWFEPFLLPLSGTTDTTLEIQLRRLVPYVHSFMVTPTGVLRVTVGHLLGAARVLRDESTWVVYFSPSTIQSAAIPAQQWTWDQMDDQTFRVSVATGDNTVTSAVWNVADSLFGAVVARCLLGQGWCTDNVR